MTGEEALKQMIAIRETGHDEEADHSMADNILCELLRSLGYGYVVDEWDKIDKWYA